MWSCACWATVASQWSARLSTGSQWTPATTIVHDWTAQVVRLTTDTGRSSDAQSQTIDYLPPYLSAALPIVDSVLYGQAIPTSGGVEVAL